VELRWLAIGAVEQGNGCRYASAWRALFGDVDKRLDGFRGVLARKLLDAVSPPASESRFLWRGSPPDRLKGLDAYTTDNLAPATMVASSSSVISTAHLKLDRAAWMVP
jgi:hypothetical protein